MQKFYADYREGKSEIDLAVAVNIKSTLEPVMYLFSDIDLVS